MTLTLVDFFCGAGGSSQGAVAVPGVTALLAANHWDRAIASHARNFPATEHYQGDLHAADLARFPSADLFWASPECKEWSLAKGRRRAYDKHPDLFGDTLPDEAADRSRALMWDVPRYLEAMALRGRPVLAGVVENVIEAREGICWRLWVRSIENLGYRTRLIALNSMHARPRVTPLAPQSRDRLYLAYWLACLGRDPDWDKWLRPPAWCPSCESEVQAVQVFKQPGRDMGRYRQQYQYHCPRTGCRGQVIEPAVLPAAAAIDWADLGTRIGDRDKPLAPKTIARIEAGLRRYAVPVTLEAAGHTFERRPGVRAWPVTGPLTTQTATMTKALASPPLLVPAGGTWRDEAGPVTGPMAARTTRENDGLAVPPLVVTLRNYGTSQPASGPLTAVVASGNHHGLVVPPFLTVHRGGPGEVRTRDLAGPLPTLTASGNAVGVAVPPLLVPVEGRDGKDAIPVTGPHRTQTARAETALAALPGMVMRNNTPRGDPGQMCTPLSDPLRTLTTQGHQSLLTWLGMLLPYYSNALPRPVSEPVGAVSTRDRFALLRADAISVEDVWFRMLTPAEIGAAMAFRPGYIVLGSKREQTRQYGNAVTPPAAEVIISALVEAITGEAIA